MASARGRRPAKRRASTEDIRRHIPFQLQCMENMLDKYGHLPDGRSWRDPEFIYEAEWQHFKEVTGKSSTATLNKAVAWAKSVARKFVDEGERQKAKRNALR